MSAALAHIECCVHDALRGRLHNRAHRKHAGHLRGVAFLQHANRHQYVHIEFGHCRRMLPHRHSVPHHHHEHGQLDIWTGHLQGIHGQHIDNTIHVVHISVHHVSRSLHSHLPSHIVAEISDANGVAHRVDDCMGRIGPHHAAHYAVCECHAQRQRSLFVRDFVAGNREPRAGSILIHHLFVFARFRHTAMLHNDVLLFGDSQVTQRCEKDKSTEGQATVTPQSDQIGIDRYHRLHTVLAALLAEPGHSHHIAQ